LVRLACCSSRPLPGEREREWLSERGKERRQREVGMSINDITYTASLLHWATHIKFMPLRHKKDVFSIFEYPPREPLFLFQR
jgi:hypothetical protein